MRLGTVWVCGALALFGLVNLRASAQEPLHPHHHLHHALWELRDARKELKEAAHDFGGHRVKALVAIKDAIKNLDLALKNAGDNIKGAPSRGDLSAEYKKYKHHPHIQHALLESKHAHKRLAESKHDFGGYRAAAQRDLGHAIIQLELCLKHHKNP
jgi:hypothetical protein